MCIYIYIYICLFKYIHTYIVAAIAQLEAL